MATVDGIAIGVLVVGIAFVVLSGKHSQPTDGLEDEIISAENVRRGVQNGWYEAVLVRVNGVPCVRLSGRTTDRKPVKTVYRISQSDFDSLQKEGYLIEL